MASDAQEVCDDYYATIRERRRNEAVQLWQVMAQHGVTSDTFITFDFRHFSADEAGIRSMAIQLAENYEVSVRLNDDRDGYWLLDGTTRPEGVDGMDADRLMAWTDFMCDVGQSYGCVFSTWRLTDASQSWSSEDLPT